MADNVVYIDRYVQDPASGRIIERIALDLENIKRAAKAVLDATPGQDAEQRRELQAVLNAADQLCG